MLYANSEGPDQTAHPRSLIRAFSVRRSILQSQMINKADNTQYVNNKNLKKAAFRNKENKTYKNENRRFGYVTV